MKILFLHGLDSQPYQDRIDLLSKYGTVDMPQIDYRKDAEIYSTYLEQASTQKYDIIIGHSLGGLLAFHICNVLNIKCLMFMPAFSSDNKKFLSLPSTTTTVIKNQNILAIISTKDQVVNNQITEDIIPTDNIVEVDDVQADNGHSLSPNLLEKWFKTFMGLNEGLITSFRQFKINEYNSITKNLFNVSTIKKDIEIEMNIQHSTHSIERTRRHDNPEDHISNEDIKSAVSTATETIVSLIIENEINIGDSILIHRTDDNLNVVGSINLKTKEDDSLVFRIITVMRKANFVPKENTYTIDI